MTKHIYPVDRYMSSWAWSSGLFWIKIEKGAEDECWAWHGSTSPFGPLFGAKTLKADGKYHPQMTQARRILWAEHTGRYLAPNQNIYHICSNKHCMNPHHLTETKVLKPREQRRQLGRKLGSRVVDGRVIPPSETNYMHLAELAQHLEVGAN